MRDHETRTLMCIPIVHTPSDMGGLAPSLRRLGVRKVGRRAWRRSITAIDELWVEIRKAVDAWRLPWDHVRLYQDGLPLCGQEEQIIADLAKAGSPNHQLLLSLMKKGARLMGTESPDLLLEEYRLVQEVFSAKNPEEAARLEKAHEVQSQSVIRRRDQFIAGRINESLLPGEIGILFLGVLHSVGLLLEKDIRVTYPIYRPRRSRGRSHDSSPGTNPGRRRLR